MGYWEQLKRLGASKNIPASLASLDSFESGRIGCRLPEDYRQFVVECSGCVFSDLVCFASVQEQYPKTDCLEGTVQSLYGLSVGKHDLLDTLERYAGEFPKGCIPIGHDLFGNQLLIETMGETSGAIRFWDHEADVALGATSTAHLLPLVARSFADFIASLRVAPA